MAKIMIVESDPNVQYLLRFLLENHGHEVIATCDGYSADNLYAQKPASLVICNLLNPSRNGLQTIQAIKSINKYTHAIIISSSDTIQELDYLKVAFEVGVEANFKKPFDIWNFTKCIDTLLAEAI